MFDRVTVLVAVNDGKQPSGTTAERAREIRALLPAGWENVVVAAWHGLTVDYCRRNGCGVIIRGVRNSGDCAHEYELAAMNEALGVTTLLLPARPELATMSSTAVRALQRGGASVLETMYANLTEVVRQRPGTAVVRSTAGAVEETYDLLVDALRKPSP
ncbi:hypothetical protein GCM10027610_026300 [Dactylosporangium cerinum]